MNKLLKEAIADAKAVRETALANAKLALEEAFTPRLQSMLSAKLSEEEGEEYVEEDEMEAPVEEPVAESEDGMDGESETLDTLKEEGEEDYIEEDEEEMMDEPAPEPEEVPVEEEEGEDDLELEAIIRELEDELEEQSDSTDIGTGDNKMDAADASDEEDPGQGTLVVSENEGEEEVTEDEEEVSIEEIIKALREEDEEEETVTEDEENYTAGVDDGAAEKDLDEAYTVIKFLKSKINEVNLLNAKLLFSNKLFRNFAMNESQKMKVIENFDRASTIREVKLVYSTLAESLKVNKTKRIVKESSASRPTRSTAPKRILSEGNQLATRWQKLAGLNK
jgi:hypothetical protein